MARSLDAAIDIANGENRPNSPAGSGNSPAADCPLVIEHAEAFRVSTDGLVKQAAFAMGLPRERADKYRSGELPSPLLQAQRIIRRMLDEGQPERSALCELRLTVASLGFELVRADDWTPTTRQIANKYGATAETKRILEDALTKLFEVGDTYEKSPSYKRGQGARRGAGRP